MSEPLQSNLKDEEDSNYECPSCGENLRQGIEIRKGGVHWCVVYCARGKCKSGVSNDGGTGKTFEEAFRDLEKKIEAEDDGEDHSISD